METPPSPSLSTASSQRPSSVRSAHPPPPKRLVPAKKPVDHTLPPEKETWGQWWKRKGSSWGETAAVKVSPALSRLSCGRLGNAPIQQYMLTSIWISQGIAISDSVGGKVNRIATDYVGPFLLPPAYARPSKRLISSHNHRSASNGSGRRAEMDQCTFQGGVASSRSKACKRRATTACACCADDCPSYSLHLRNIADVVAYPGHDEPRLRLCLALPASALLAFTLPPNSSPSNFVHHVMHIHSEMEKAARILRGTLTFCLARTSSGRQRSG